MKEFMKPCKNTDAKFSPNIKNYEILNGADNAIECVMYNLYIPFASQKCVVILTHTRVGREVSKYA